MPEDLRQDFGKERLVPHVTYPFADFDGLPRQLLDNSKCLEHLCVSKNEVRKPHTKDRRHERGVPQTLQVAETTSGNDTSVISTNFLLSHKFNFESGNPCISNK